MPTVGDKTCIRHDAMESPSHVYNLSDSAYLARSDSSTGRTTTLLMVRMPCTVSVAFLTTLYIGSSQDTYVFSLNLFHCHGMSVADNVYHTKTVLKYFKSRSQSSSGDGLPSCTLSKSVAINFLREAITAKQLRIELWVQSSSSKSSSSSANWELDRQASPGNFEEVEDLLFDSSSQNITESPMCLAITYRIKDGIKSVGIAYIDSVERRLGVTEFVENDIFSNTEVCLVIHIEHPIDLLTLYRFSFPQSLLIQLGVKEVLIPAEEKTTEIEAQKLRKLVERCGIVFTERKRSKLKLSALRLSCSAS
jgi:DNA mismatch repair protein MSH2